MVPRVEKTEVFRKGWNFANRTYFPSCIMRKHHFLLWTKETAFFSYFYRGIIFYSPELFDCAINYKLMIGMRAMSHQFYLELIWQNYLQEHSHWGGRGCPPHPTTPHTHTRTLQLLNQKRSNSFSFKHLRYCLLWVFRNYTDKKFHDFYRVCYNLWTIYGRFSFF